MMKIRNTLASLAASAVILTAPVSAPLLRTGDTSGTATPDTSLVKDSPGRDQSPEEASRNEAKDKAIELAIIAAIASLTALGIALKKSKWERS